MNVNFHKLATHLYTHIHTYIYICVCVCEQMTSCISIANTSIAEDYSHILKLVHAQLVPLSGDVGQPLLITLHTSILQFVCKV